MPDDPVRLRPIEEADLNLLRRLDTDPAARGCMRDLAFIGGRWRDGVLYARLRGDMTGPGD